MMTSTLIWFVLTCGLAISIGSCAGATRYAQHRRARYSRFEGNLFCFFFCVFIYSIWLCCVFLDHDDYLSMRGEDEEERKPFVVGRDADESLSSYETTYGSTGSTRRSSIWSNWIIFFAKNSIQKGKNRE